MEFEQTAVHLMDDGGDAVVCTDPDSSGIRLLSAEELSRSVVMSDAIESMGSTTLDVVAPAGFISAWLRLLEAEQHDLAGTGVTFNDTPVTELVTMLQAADFHGDQEGIWTASHALAALMVSSMQASMLSGDHHEQAGPASAGAADPPAGLLQALETLQRELVMKVFAAAVASSRRSERSLSHSALLQMWLPVLSPGLHDALFTACFPGVPEEGALVLDSFAPHALALRVVEWAATGPPVSSHALTRLEVLHSQQRAHRQHTGSTGDFAPALAVLTSLQSLTLHLSSTPNMSSDLLLQLSTLAALTELHLNISNAETRPRVRGLPSLHRLTVLCGTWGIDELLCELAAMSSLWALHVDNPAMYDLGVGLQLELSRLRFLTELDLRHCHPGPKHGVTLAGGLAGQFAEMPSLRALRLGDNMLREVCCRCMSPNLRSMTALLELDLSRNDFGDEGLASLAPALQNLSELQRLNVTHNDVSDAGIKTLAVSIQHLSCLRELRVGENAFHDAGVETLAELMHLMGGLRVLGLEWVDMTVVGAIALARCLTSLTELHELHLASVVMGEQGTLALIESLGALGKLRKLDLRGCRVPPDAMTKLGGILGGMVALQEISLSCKAVDDAAVRAVVEQLSKLRSLTHVTMSLASSVTQAARAMFGCKLAHVKNLNLSFDVEYQDIDCEL